VLDGLALELEGGAIDVTEGTIAMCTTCTTSLRTSKKNKPPSRSLANQLRVGPKPKELQGLTWAETKLLALFRPIMHVVCLQGASKVQPDSTLNSGSMRQTKLHGNCYGAVSVAAFFHALFQPLNKT